MILEFNFADDDDFGIDDIQELTDLHNTQVRFAIITSVIEAIENGQPEAPFLRVTPGDIEMSVQPRDYMNAIEKHAQVLIELEEFEWARRCQLAKVNLSSGLPL